MEILDHNITALPPKQKLNWVGKVFHLGELLWILLWVILYAGALPVMVNNIEWIVFLYFLYYLIGGSIYSLFGNAFDKTLEKAFALLAFGATLTPVVIIGFYTGPEYGPPISPKLILWLTLITALVPLLFFLASLIFRRNSVTSKWAFVAMIIRLGLYSLAILFIIRMLTIFENFD